MSRCISCDYGCVENNKCTCTKNDKPIRFPSMFRRCKYYARNVSITLRDHIAFLLIKLGFRVAINGNICKFFQYEFEGNKYVFENGHYDAMTIDNENE